MQNLGLIISRLMPVLLLIGVGLILRIKGILKESETTLIKKLILNAALPAVLFISFYRIELKRSFIAVVVAVFLLNVLLLGIGMLVSRRQKGRFTPFLYTGFEYGMFCIGVFATAYGNAALPFIAVIALGHELFIWFVYVTFLTSRAGSRKNTVETLKAFVKSPMIIAILLGLIANAAGLAARETAPLWGGLVSTVSTLGSITGPLILLTIGAGLTINRNNLLFAFTTATIRIPLVLVLFYLTGVLFFGRLLGLPNPYIAGLFTLLIAPPPFIIPLFMPEGLEAERGRINTTLTVMTLIALGLFIVYFAANPVLSL